MTTSLEHRKILDDVFNAFTVLGRGNYVSICDAKGKMLRYSPAAVEAFGLAGEYISADDIDWANIIHPEDRFKYTRTMTDLFSGAARNYDITCRTKLKDGTYASIRYAGAAIGGDDAKPELVGGVMINEGLTESTDPVTLLRNRYGFFRDLIAAIELKRSCVVMLCGINKMSNIRNTVTRSAIRFCNRRAGSFKRRWGRTARFIAWTARSSLS